MYRGPIAGPPGWPAHEYEDALNDRAMGRKEYRQEISYRNPLIFGLLYCAEFGDLMLRHVDALDEGSPKAVFMNDVHVDIARWGSSWMRKDTQPGDNRHAWIAPRGSAKSTWLLTVLPLWAAVFQHRNFIAMFGMTKKAITKSHMVNLINHIRGNDLLRFDYPNFCTPAPGTVATQSEYQSINGTTIVAAGIGEGVLGLNRGGARPDTILFDDLDDAEGDFSPTTTASRLATMRQGILGMTPRAVVGWAGTVPTRGSLCDQLVRHELGESVVPWVEETKFRTHYYPAIMTDRDGSQRSLWPIEWDLKWMLSQRGIRDFELNFMNRPPNAGSTFWEQRHFVYGIPRGWMFSRYVMWVDPAVTNNTKSDFSGIAVVGYAENVRKAGVMMSGNLKVSPEQLKVNVRHALLQFYPLGLREIMVESNQGGTFLRTALSGLESEFPGIKITLPRSESNRGKAVEFAEAFTHYQRERVRHSQQFRVAEEQLMMFPNGRNDDCGEAIVRGVNEILAHMPKLAAA